MKQCSCCKQYKDETNFYKRLTGKNGLYCSCKDCNKKRAMEWKKNNPEKVKHQCKKAYTKKVSTPEGRKKHNDTCKKWIQNNLKKHKQIVKKGNDKRLSTHEGRKKDRERATKWVKNNRERFNEYMKNYHRKKTGYTGPITKICILCGKEYSTPQYHQKYCGKKCRTKIENRNKQKGSRKELKWIPVYENPFHPTEKIHEHHIDNNHIVVLPADIHLCYAGCHTRNDNDDLDYIIKQIYPTFERSEFRT